MFFIYSPDTTPVYYDPEEAFREYQRREYVKHLQEERQRRALFERELQLEEARHRAALAQIAENEKRRRAQIQQQESAARQYAQQQQPQRYARYPTRDIYQPQQTRPTPREILARRLARQQEEERRSRQFHQNILSHIFGVPVEELEQSMDEDYEEEEEEEEGSQAEETPRQPTLAQLINEFAKRQQLPDLSPPVRRDSVSQPISAGVSSSQPASAPIPTAVTEKTVEPTLESTTMEVETEEPLSEPEAEPHWSSAPERARSLAEISAIDRSFNCIKSTFAFPSGPLQRLPGSAAPRLAYNSTNAPIHAYEHGLTDLLSKLDGIESYGFKGIREARKQLVVKIEKELEELEKKIAERLTGAIEAKDTPASVPTDALPKDTVDSMTVPTPALQVGSEQASPAVAPVNSTGNDKMDILEASSIAMPTPRSGEPVDAMTIPTPVIQPVAEIPKADQSVPPATVTLDSSERPRTDTDPAAEPPSTTVPAERIPLPETMSDEELELEDAIHIDVTDDESNALNKTGKEHKTAVGEFEML